MKELNLDNIPIYPSLGNHEKFPNDQFYPYDSEMENKTLKTIGEYWKKWLGEDAYETFIKFGYYSKMHMDTKLKIISYNCLFCDTINFKDKRHLRICRSCRYVITFSTWINSFIKNVDIY